jgi:hypothetical protein
MRRRFEGRQQAARVGGKGHAKGNGCGGHCVSGAMARGNRHQHERDHVGHSELSCNECEVPGPAGALLTHT